ncbi:hypothetical protein M1D88_09740 [Arthrobacter sp. R1-13]
MDTYQPETLSKQQSSRSYSATSGSNPLRDREYVSAVLLALFRIGTVILFFMRHKYRR